MTREEAIKRLEDTLEAWERWECPDDSPSALLNKALGMAISALRGQPRWISVTERLPEHGQLVLGYCINNIFLIVRWDNKTGVWLHKFAEFRKEFVAHWMPLPSPPTEGENG